MTLRFVCVLLFSLVPAAYAQLSGTYTVGPNGDFPSINDAVDQLNSEGIGDPVTFLLEDGVFDEQVVIEGFPRSGAPDAAVVFTPENAGQVTWVGAKADASNNWVVQVIEASYVSFAGIVFDQSAQTTYGRVLAFKGARHITVDGCTLRGIAGSASLDAALVFGDETSANDENNRFEDSIFEDGGYGVYLKGVSAANRAAGNVVEDNVFLRQGRAGAWLEDQSTSRVLDNDVIDSATSGSNFVGLVVGSPGALVETNRVRVSQGSAGIRMINSSGGASETVRNNMIALDGPNAAAGLRMSTGGATVAHNSIRVTSANATATGVRVSVSGVSLNNNLVTNEGGGLALSIATDGDLVAADHNVYYTTGATLAEEGGVSFPLLTDYQAATGLDVNARSVPVTFTLATGAFDLHLAGSSVGDAALAGPRLAAVLTDYDGDARGTTTYLGADEAATPFAPLAGTYTVGGTSPDYPTLTAAAFAITNLGASAPVTFRVRNGTYDEQITIGTITRTVALDDLVTFEAETSGLAVWTHSGSGASNNWLIRLRETSYVRIAGFRFDQSAQLDNGTVIQLDLADHIEIEQNTFEGIPGLNGLNSSALIVDQRGPNEHTRIANNTMLEAAYALRLDAGGTPGSKAVVEGNRCLGQKVAAITSGFLSVGLIQGNFFADGAASLNVYTGLYADRDTEVRDNQFLVTQGESGVQAFLGAGPFINNMIYIAGPNARAGLLLRSGDIDFLHNTVRVGTSSNAPRVVEVDGSSST